MENFIETCGPQLYGSGVPQPLWRLIFEKLESQTMDAGDDFQLAMDEDFPDDPYCLAAQHELQAEANVWLVDHALTFRVREVRALLRGDPGLLARLERMLCGGHDDEKMFQIRDDEDAKGLVSARVESVCALLWQKASHYRIASENQIDTESCWYVEDEIGTAVTRVVDAEVVNAKLVPFFYPPHRVAYSILFCTDDIGAGELVCCAAPGDTKLRATIASAENWRPQSVDDGDDDEGAEAKRCVGAFQARKDEQERVWAEINRTVADWKDVSAAPESEAHKKEKKKTKKIFTDLQLVMDTFGKGGTATATATATAAPAAEYSLVDDMDEADIVWIAEYCEELVAMQNPDAAVCVSQFPGELNFCHKGHMAATVQRALGCPPWLPATYDSRAPDGLDCFIGDFLTRQSQQEANTWIVKPVVMARSTDMVISDNLRLLCRLTETGPRVLCKYVDRPLLFGGRKFDLRFVVLLRDVRLSSPCSVEAYVHRRFYLRRAQLPYQAADYDEYRRHWTVMNYDDAAKAQMDHMRCEDFVPQLDAEHGAGTWDSVWQRTRVMLRQFLFAVAQQHGATMMKRSAAQRNVKCAAMYGVDVMVTQDLQPVLLECNFSPDSTRCCAMYPDFFVDVFSTLFEGVPRNCEAL